MKKLWKHGSTVLLIIIVSILLVPSWRVPFQGLVSSIFMADLNFEKQTFIEIPSIVENWELENLNGTKHSFQSLNDKPVVISFWATWCPPCRTELKELKTLKDYFGDKVHFLSVSEESLEVIKNSGLHESYDFLYSTLQFPRFFSVNAYPTLCIIDSNHQLIFKHSGAGGLDNEKNIDFLKGLL